MSKGNAAALPVIEWSRGAVRLFDPVTKRTQIADSIADLVDVPKQAVLALSRRTAFLRMATLPNARREDMRAIVGIQLANHFPVPSHELAFDFVPTEATSSEGRQVLLVAVRLVDLRLALDALKARGVTPVKVVPTALGSALLAAETGMEAGAFVEETPEGVAIDLVDHRLTRVSRLASSHGAGTLAAEIDRTYSANEIACGPVVSTGGLVFAEAERKVNSSPLEALSAGYSALGLSLELPEAVHLRQKKIAGQRNRFAVLAALSALLLGALVWDERDRAAGVVSQGEAKWQGELRRARSIRDGNLADAAVMAKSEETLSRALMPAQRTSDVLTAFSNALPPSVWLVGYSFERGKPVQVRGTAKTSLDVKAYLANLEKESRLRDVRLSFANVGKIDDIPVVQFSITGTPVGNLPLAEPERTKKR